MAKFRDARAIIEALHLEPLAPEGGMFRSTYTCRDMYGERSLASAIYYFLQGAEFSHLHRLDADELYHFYLGDPVEMLLLAPDGTTQHVFLGTDIAAGERPQVLVPAGWWQGCRLQKGGRYALMGTTMSPGYAASGYQQGDPHRLTQAYPGYQELILQLCTPTDHHE